MYKKALLINENGDEFIGWSTEEFKPVTGELIFNTAMTGFVEILSDPSYVNQIITFICLSYYFLMFFSSFQLF